MELELNSYLLINAESNDVLDSKGQVYKIDEKPVKLGALVDSIVSFISIAVSSTFTVIGLKRQSDFLKAQERLLAQRTAIVNAISEAYAGYNLHTFEVDQQIKNMKSAIKDRISKLSGYTFVSEEQRLGGLIQNGYAELEGNGFGAGILETVNSTYATCLNWAKSGDREKALNTMDNLSIQLLQYGLCITTNYKSFENDNKSDLKISVLPLKFAKKDFFDFSLITPDNRKMLLDLGHIIPKNSFWCQIPVIYYAYDNFTMIINTLKSIGSPSWLYRAFFNNQYDVYNNLRNSDYTNLKLNIVGYERSKQDFVMVQNFVNGYNELSYEQMIFRIKIKENPLKSLSEIQSKIADVNRRLKENDESGKVYAAKAGLGRALAKEKSRYIEELSFCQAVITSQGLKIVDNTTGETSTGETVIGTGKTSEQIAKEAEAAKQEFSISKALENIQKQKTEISPLVIAAGAGFGAYLLAKV